MTAHTSPPSWRRLWAVWGKIGLMSFGGPAAQIALMHRVIVDDEKWLSEARFLNALSFCMLLPGPEAMQVATYVGWRLRGVWGGLLAGMLFIMPGAMVIFALALLYFEYGHTAQGSALFSGINAAVLGIVIHALRTMARRNLTSLTAIALATLSFIGLFFFNAPFPLVILSAGVAGYLLSGRPSQADQADRVAPTIQWRQSLFDALLWGSLWAVPLVLISLFGGTPVYGQLSLYFSKLAVVSFGGAYAGLAYMTQAAVETHSWVSAEDMLNALGLAETTPGPLILVTQFIGTLAGLSVGSITTGLIAGCVTLWATFVPCFLWVFLGAPYIERLDQSPRLRAALRGILAAVVGVMINLSVWFGLRVMFEGLTPYHIGPMTLTVPQMATVDPWSIVMIGVAVTLLALRPSAIVMTLVICAALGWGGAQIPYL